MSNRIDYWDYLKGLCVILVLVGHTIIYTVPDSYIDNKIFLFIYSFHMPLFMFISGYFFYFSLSRHLYKDILLKKIKTLLFPIFIFGTIYYFLTIIREGMPDNPLGKYYVTIINTLWFLSALFVSCLIVLIVEKINKKKLIRKNIFLIYLFIVAILMMLPDTANSAGFKSTFPAFIFGFYVNKLELFSWYKRHRIPTVAVALFIFSILFIFFEKNILFYISGVYLFNGERTVGVQLYYNVFRIIIGLVGSIAFIAVTEIIFNKLKMLSYLNSFIIKFGRHSKGIYCFQMYLFVLYNKFSSIIYDSLVLRFILTFMIVSMLSYLFSLLSSKVPALGID